MPVEATKLVTALVGGQQDLLINIAGINPASTIIITGIPDGGEIRKANGDLLAVNDIITDAELAGLIFVAGTLSEVNILNTFTYEVSFGGTTETGTVNVGSLNPDPLTYFTGYEGGGSFAGAEIFQINPDGTVSNTAQILPGVLGVEPDNYTAFQGAIYFTAELTSAQNTLHRLDPDGTVTQVSAFNMGSDYTDDPLDLTIFNDELYFRADNGTDGMELYRVNDMGVVELVSDINGGGNSNPKGFTEFNGALYFQADDGTNGVEIHRVNGSGVVEFVMDINSGAAGSFPTEFAEFNGALYFTANTAAAGSELYRVNGSGAVEALPEIAAGTTYAFETGGFSRADRNFTEFNGELYFQASNGTDGFELYRVTAAGAVELVSDINPTGDSRPEWFTEFNGALYFSADNGTDGTELYRVNDTGAVEYVADLNMGIGGGMFPNSSDPDIFTEFNGALYFDATSTEYGSELYRVTFDGQVERVTDLNPGAAHANIEDLTVSGEYMYFEASVNGIGDELFRMNSLGEVELVADVNTYTHGGFSDPSGVQQDAQFTVYNGELYFRAYAEYDAFGGTLQSNMYRITAAGAMEEVIFPDIEGFTTPRDFTEFNGALYFDAYSDQDGRELYRLLDNGQVELVSDISTGQQSFDPNFPNNSSPDLYTEFNGALYFEANTAAEGSELYRITADGVVELVMDINPGAGPSSIMEFSVFNNALYFGASTGAGWDLFRVDSDGVAAPVSDLNPGADFNSVSGGFAELNGANYFIAENSAGGSNLHRIMSNGYVQQYLNGINGVRGERFDADTFTEFNGALYFEGSDAANGTELFRVTSAGDIELAADITPGTGSTLGLDGFTVFNGAMYFRAEDTSGTIGRELYRMTSTGTVELVMDLNPGTTDGYANHGRPNEFTEFNGYLYFDAVSDSVGRELYRINSSGVVEFVLDINLGSNNSSPTNYFVFNDALYFTADNGTAGGELYRVDVAGNVNALAELNTQTDGFFPTSFFVPEAISLEGTTGNDIINGSNAGETITGGLGNDTLNGNGGNDIITGGEGNNVVNGGDGNDIISVESGLSVIDGGDGNDTLTLNGANFAYTFNMVTGVTNYTGESAINIENFIGAGSVDTITGSADANRIETFGGNDIINAGGGDDVLDGGADNDTVNGEGGNDTLFASAGTDTFNGGADIDTYYIDGTSEEGLEHIFDQTVGNTDVFGNSFFLIENFVGGDMDDLFMMATSGSEANRLDGRAGADTLFGGAGNDFIIGGAGGDFIDGGTGTDRLSYITSFGVTLDLTNSANNTGHAIGDTISTIEEIEGSDYADTLRGDGNANVLFGLGGNDTLEGLGGADILTGGAGNDIIDGGDVADILSGGEGHDIITGGAGGDFVAGGDGNDHFLFNGISDINIGLETIHGGAGFDSLVVTANAVSGNSIDLRGSIITDIEEFFFDNQLTDVRIGINADQIGTGLISSTANIRGRNNSTSKVEITMGSSTLIDIGGWTFTDWFAGEEIWIQGDSDAEVIGGSRSRDIIFVDGGDFVNGRGGDDVFFILPMTDYVSTDTVLGGDGVDSLALFNVGPAAYDLRGATFESLELLTVSPNFSGNDVTATLNAAQVAPMGLLGLAGNQATTTTAEVFVFNMEALTTFSVNDLVFSNWTDGTDMIVINGDGDSEFMLGSSMADTINGNGGNDALYGYGGADILIGGVNADVLWGGDGIDSMSGGAGDDTYLIEQSGDLVFENSGEGNDTVYVFVDYVMAANVEIAVGLADGATNITGNATDNVIISSSTTATSNISGGGGNDTLYVQASTFVTGGAGNDVFVLGGSGNSALGGTNDDIYIVNAAGNTLTELVGEGIDTVYSNLSDYTLGDNLETLVLLGVNANGTGSAQNNTIIGNGGNNNIMGMAGADFLIGGGGNDFITGGAGSDVMQGNGGLDTYVYNSAGELGDTIQDWIAADDGFLFNAAAFGFVAGGSLTDGVNFFTDTGPAFALASFIWDSVNTALYYDADGSGAGGPVLVADLQAFTDVTVADFAFV